MPIGSPLRSNTIRRWRYFLSKNLLQRTPVCPVQSGTGWKVPYLCKKAWKGIDGTLTACRKTAFANFRRRGGIHAIAAVASDSALEAKGRTSS